MKPSEALALAVLALFVVAGTSTSQAAQANRSLQNRTAATTSGDAAVETLHVQGSVYVLAGRGANVVVHVGSLGVVVVDPGLKEGGDGVLEAIRTLTDKPIRYVINTHAHEDHSGANEQLASSGAAIGDRRVAVVGSGQLGRAEIIAHELVLNRMSAPGSSDGSTPVGAWPTATFALREKTFFTNGEGVQIIHQPAAHTDGDSVVFFRRSDVIAAGDIYSTVSYPVIDREQGGSITGVLDGLNQLLALAIAGEKVEGGTMIVPGHGRISDEADLVEYRDMVTIVRDRVQDLIKRGMTLDQVQAKRPTMEYDGLYGGARGWTADQFVEAVYRGLANSTGTAAFLTVF